MPITRKRLYIAGPMRGYPESNFPAFYEAEEALADLGHVPFNPARIDVEKRGYDPRGLTQEECDQLLVTFDVKEALHDDISWIINESEGVVLLPGWSFSTGARLEALVATMTGKDTYLYLNSTNPLVRCVIAIDTWVAEVGQVTT